MFTKSRYIFPILYLTAILFLSGCSFKLGTAETVIRPSISIPHVIVDTGSGEYLHQPGVDSDGDGAFLLFRGSF